MDYKQNKEIVKVIKTYEKLRKKYEKAIDAREKVMKKKCSNCDIYFGYVNNSLKNLFENCGSCDYVKKLKCVHHEMNVASKEVSDYKIGESAVVLYAELSKYAPSLYSVKQKKNIAWHEAYGKPFEKLNDVEKATLIMLLYGGSGLYRFS